MTQSPTEAWLKEAYRAARENFEKENPHLANDEYYKQNPEKSMTFRAHLAGQQCERERSATDEQERIFVCQHGVTLGPLTPCDECIRYSCRLSIVQKSLDEARAEATSLRAENERLRKALEWELEYLMGCTFQGSRHPFQTQIDKLRAALEIRKARGGS